MEKQELRQFFQETIEQHSGIIQKVARTYCQNAEDRHDLIQEIMIQIWQASDKFNDQYKISTWLYRISLNVAISFYRKNSARAWKFTTLNDQLPQKMGEANSISEEHHSLLQQFIGELRELDKAIMLLYLEEKSYNEIAEILGMSVSNVGTKIGRIKEKLRAQFSLIKT